MGSAPAAFAQSDHLTQLANDLKDKSWAVRLDAAFALGKLKDPRTVEPLMAALNDADADVRRSAAAALGQIEDLRAVQPLLATLKDKDAQVRGSAVSALSEIGDHNAVGPLIVALKDSDTNVRRNAADGLGALKDPLAVDPLIAALGDEEADVRLRAARALGKIQDPRADQPLMAALKGKEKPVVGGAYRFFIAKGEEGSEDALVASLAQFGSKDMALDFLNCGNQKLADAGREWAKRNGYTIITDPNGESNNSVLWGSERLLAMSSVAKAE